MLSATSVHSGTDGTMTTSHGLAMYVLKSRTDLQTVSDLRGAIVSSSVDWYMCGCLIQRFWRVLLGSVIAVPHLKNFRFPLKSHIEIAKMCRHCGFIWVLSCDACDHVLCQLNWLFFSDKLSSNLQPPIYSVVWRLLKSHTHWSPQPSLLAESQLRNWHHMNWIETLKTTDKHINTKPTAVR